MLLDPRPPEVLNLMKIQKIGKTFPPSLWLLNKYPTGPLFGIICGYQILNLIGKI